MPEPSRLADGTAMTGPTGKIRAQEPSQMVKIKGLGIGYFSMGLFQARYGCRAVDKLSASVTEAVEGLDRSARAEYPVRIAQLAGGYAPGLRSVMRI